MNKCIFKSFSPKTTSSEFKAQIMNNISSFVNSSAVINGSDFLAVVFSSKDMNPEEQLKNGISAVDLGNCTQVIKNYYNISKGEDIIVLNMETKNDKNQINETKNNNNDNSFNLGKNTQLEIYDSSGRKLDISVCKQEITVMKYIGNDVEKLDIQSAQDLANMGIDVFNANDDFFNDICLQYNNTDGKDIILTDRRTDIFQNATFCQDGCIYSGMDYEFMAAHCICDSSALQGGKNDTEKKEEAQKENVNFKSITKSFISNLLDFNFEVMKCYNLVFNIDIIFSNYGFYSLVSMFFLQMIFLFIFLFKKLKPLKYFMLIFSNNDDKIVMYNPPPKINKNIVKTLIKNENDKDTTLNIEKEENMIKKINKNNIKNKNIILHGNNINDNSLISEDDNNSKKKINIKNHNQNILGNLLANNELNNNQEIKDIKGQMIFINKYSPNINIHQHLNKKISNRIISHIREGNNIDSKTKSNLVLLNQNKENNNNKSNNKIVFRRKNKLKRKNTKISLNQMETIGEKEKDKSNNNISKTDYELQDMDYEEAIIYDKRSYLKMYWSFLIDSQIILGTFCTENYLNLFIIKLSFFIFTFQISFFLNALFYTDEYISDAYHNDGILDFFSGLPKSIYSFIATLISTNLLKILSNSKSELLKLIREKRNDQNYNELISNKLKKLRNKLIAYFSIIFLLGLFFSYYVISFCSVYRNSQKYWFLGCLESFGIDSLVSVIICIILAIFRFISIQKHCKCLYIFANIISIFF